MDFWNVILDTDGKRAARRKMSAARFEKLITETLHIPVQHFWLFYVGIIAFLVYINLVINGQKMKNRITQITQTSAKKPLLDPEEFEKLLTHKHYLLLIGVALIILSCIPL